MTATSMRLGRAGETAVAEWYVTRGYRVVARNWRCRDGEIDLIAARGRLVAICEVKSRTGDAFGSPAEAVTWRKQSRLRRLAGRWLDDAAAQAGQAAQAAGWPDDAAGQTGQTGQTGQAGQAGRTGRTGRGRPSVVRFDVASVVAGRVDVIEGAF